jgi:hypothetical protein
LRLPLKCAVRVPPSVAPLPLSGPRSDGVTTSTSVRALLGDVAGGVGDADLQRPPAAPAWSAHGLVAEVRAGLLDARRAGAAPVGARARAVVLAADDPAAAEVEDLDAADAAVVAGVERDGVGAVAAPAGEQPRGLDGRGRSRRVVEHHARARDQVRDRAAPAVVHGGRLRGR